MDQEVWPTEWSDDAADPDLVIDRELQAAIEYTIATAGLGGVERILQLVNIALSRRLGEEI